MQNTTLPLPTRRIVLAGLGGSVAGAAILTVPLIGHRGAQRYDASKKFEGKRQPLLQATVEQWTSEIGSIFYAGTEAGALALKLISVSAVAVVGSRPGALRAKPFEVVFEAVGKRKIPAGDRLYPMRHAQYGDFHLYFSPSGRTLKAIFN